MRGVRITTDGIRVLDLPDPEAGGVVDGVVIDVATVGICGSDLHLAELGPRDTTLGHEVGGWLEGRPVTFSPVIHCGECGPCRAGRSAICRVGSAAPYGIGRDGGMAERVSVDRSAVVDLPEGVDATDAFLVEPLAVGEHALNVAGVTSGMRVAVVGAGTVGLVAGALARHRGAEVDIAARHPHQQRAAEALGLGANPSGRYDVAVDAAGTDTAVAQAVKLCQAGGTLLIAGTYWGPVTMPGLALQLKELRILPAIYYGHHEGEREIDVAARLLPALPGLSDVLVTHRFPLEDATEAFRVAADKTSGAIKVVLDVA